MTASRNSISLEDLGRRLPSSVGLLAVTYDEDSAATWHRWLSEEERACIRSFGAESRRREFVAGRAAARTLLSRELNVDPSGVPLRRAEDDGVDVDRGEWHLSIAHSGPHAVAVCAQHPIGVDLEHIEPRDPAIARFLFAPGDRGTLDGMPFGEDASLVLCWSLKEAVLKGQRTGFRTSPKDVGLALNPDRGTARADVVGGGRWALVYAESEGYWAAVAVPAD